MKRRAFFHGLTVFPVAVLSSPAFAGKPPEPAVVVYHFVAPTCDECQRWDHKYLPRWLNSGEFRRTSYRRIEGRTAEELQDPQRWPPAIRDLAGSPQMRRSPAFVVMRQGRTVAAASGETAWTEIIWPAIRMAAA